MRGGEAGFVDERREQRAPSCLTTLLEHALAARGRDGQKKRSDTCSDLCTVAPGERRGKEGF